MGAAALPFIVFTIFWGGVGIVLPIIVPKGPNRGIIQVILMLTGITCWLFWLCCYVAQMNPLIGPKLDRHTILIVAREWGNELKNVCKTWCRFAHLDWSPNKKLCKEPWDRYRNLPAVGCKIEVTYIWVDGTGENVRAKAKTMDYTPASYKDCPNWSCDGSSSFLSDPSNSDIILCPVALYNDPVIQGDNKLVLCETYTSDGKPTCTNRRHPCMETLNKACDKEPVFGFEQEYYLMDVNRRPFGWPVMLGEPCPTGHAYCGIGAEKTYGRELAESHYRCCLASGIEIAGINAEASPSQWECQIGPSRGIKAGDDLWMARFLLQRVAEDYGVAISYHPKLFPNWSGSGLHTNFSTKPMREEGGYKCILEGVQKLEQKHAEHLKIFDCKEGRDNCLRLTGEYKTSRADKFTCGTGDRNASIRITNRVSQKQKGYFQDRRPGASADPYELMNALVSTICLC